MFLKQAINLGGREITMETGRIAKQADGAVLISCGETVILVSAVSARKAKDGQSFFPLTVDYREYGYASGRIPGGYFKREGRPTEREILICRLTDRPLRPLFPEGYLHETQIISMVMSADKENDPDVLSITGASAALYLSDIPFHTPIAGVRVGLVEGKYVVNPTYEEQRASALNLILAGSEEAIVMVEAGAKEVSEQVMVEALLFGHNEIKKLCQLQRAMGEKLGIKKREFITPAINEELLGEIAAKYTDSLRDALDVTKHGKIESYAKIAELHTECEAGYPAEEPAKRKEAGKLFDTLKERIFRDDILNNRRRPDGRKFSEIRPITIETTVLPRPHGSALFTRGETQAIVTATLGTSQDVQYLDSIEFSEIKRRFILNYNFPPFSVGETGRTGSPGRREIGHGALAHRALEAVMPDDTEWPYVVRVVSDITESNGSSSMATVCGGALAMMDAGVPLKAPVAGVAMGLVMEGGKYAVLTDIAGAEDHYGDMDFKVAGTRDGITALQMDIKIGGLNAAILAEAMEQARKGRMYILDKMAEVLPEPRAEISKYAPRIITLMIPTDKIRDLIGPGGKIIRGIVEQTGAKIDVEDSGRVSIATADGAAGAMALQMVKDITAEAEPGATYLGTVTRIVDFGAFIEIFPGTEGLLHVSEIAPYRVHDVRDELTEGQQVLVKCLGVEGNKIRLSKRALMDGGEGGGEGGEEGGDDAGNREGGGYRDRDGGRRGGGSGGGGGRDRRPSGGGGGRGRR
ncbi:MAG: polyribonucleotide nucleotidyltransferase [Acidobacteria bacterium]|nr:polyribonucleotide nucleotidyltransferase [Acidobacteriota bacterium]